MGVGDTDQYMEADSPVSPAGSAKVKTPQAVVQPQTNNTTGEFETSFTAQENTNNNHVLAQHNTPSLNSNGSLPQTPGVLWVPIAQGQSLPQNITVPTNAQQSPILLPPGVSPVADLSQTNPGYMVKFQQGFTTTPTGEPQMRFGMPGNRVSEVPTNVYEDLPDPPPRPSNLPTFNDSSNRRRANPLYGDSFEKTRSRSESPDNCRSPEEQALVPNRTPNKKKQNRYCCCVAVMVLVCFVLLGAATFSILISLKIINIPISASTVKETDLKALDPAALVDSSNVTLLMEKIRVLNKNMTDMGRKIATQNSELSALKSSRFNVSECEYQVAIKNVSTSLATFMTPAHPTKIESSSYSIISASCSYLNANNSQLIFNKTTDPQTYRCSCTGIFKSSIRERSCSLHYWRCPIRPYRRNANETAIP